MKRTTRHDRLSRELVRKPGLKIAKETVKVLSSDELSKAASWCPTDSLTGVPTGTPSVGC